MIAEPEIDTTVAHSARTLRLLAEGQDPYPVVKTLLDALPAGSRVAITRSSGDSAYCWGGVARKR